MQRLRQGALSFGVDRYLQNAGELAGQVRHAALQPITAVSTNGLRQGFNQAGFVVGHNVNSKTFVHAKFLSLPWVQGWELVLFKGSSGNDRMTTAKRKQQARSEE